jgi:antitoxin MazE
MKSKIVKIGNSQCIRIPKSIIELCNIKEEISIRVVDKNLLIEPINNTRKNWEKKFFDNNTKDKLIIDFSNDFDNKEWEW